MCARILVRDGFAILVERAGRFNRLVRSGESSLDALDKVAGFVSLKDELLKVGKTTASTQDGKQVLVSGYAHICVVNPVWAFYCARDYREMTRDLLRLAVHDVLGEMRMKRVDVARRQITDELKSFCTPRLKEWGIALREVLLERLLPLEGLLEFELVLSLQKRVLDSSTRKNGFTEPHKLDERPYVIRPDKLKHARNGSFSLHEVGKPWNHSHA